VASRKGAASVTDDAVNRGQKAHNEGPPSSLDFKPQQALAISSVGGALARYDTACRALAEARSVDEVKTIRDKAVAMAVYARQAKNRDLEADAVEIRMRATPRLDQLRVAQKETVGLNRGAAGGGERAGLRGALVAPRDLRPTLDSQGIDKHLAKQARVLGAMDEAAFERKVEDARRSAVSVYRRAVREAEIQQERAERRARTALGGSVTDLHALIASGFRAGTIAVDPPWPFTAYSDRANSIPPYDTMTFEEIKALPVRQLAADDCALFLWCTWPNMPMWVPVLEAWGFTFSGLGFDWVKLNPNVKPDANGWVKLNAANSKGLHWGTSYGTRANSEPCLLAKVGKPLRLDGGVHSVIMTPVGEHSEKPDEAYRRMEKLYGGPRLELFARKERPGWTTWGNEIAREQLREAAE
jgi:N6-adenosine-specific RNA methylase IME4